jgi:hypothetical protein
MAEKSYGGSLNSYIEVQRTTWSWSEPQAVFAIFGFQAKIGDAANQAPV